ncbi:MAG: toxin [Bifidobacteriaceae bacterium]|jgi:hypothetical protein|nr:toxin [Bifidobacteriaceae bacterium]
MPNLVPVRLVVADSARKHGIGDDDISAAVFGAVAAQVIDQDPEKVLYLGFDTHARLLETVAVTEQGSSVLVIHAMPCRRSYIEAYLRRR